VEMKAMSIADFGPSPFKIALLSNLDKVAAPVEKAPKKAAPSIQQKPFSQSVLKLETIKGRISRTPVNRIGDFTPVEDSEDQGMGSDISELVFKAVDNKASNVLVRARGNRLTKKQADIKAVRIAAKA
jgi:hypothetical protein